MTKRVKAEEIVNNHLSNVFEAAKQSISDATSQAKEKAKGPEAQLMELAKDYEKGYVKIYRKAPNSNKRALFAEFEYAIEEFLRRGPDSLCKEYGGGGEYEVRLSIPGESQARVVYKDLIVAGPAMEAPLGSPVDVLPNMSGLPNFGSQTPFGMPSVAPRGQDKAVETLAKQNEQTINLMQGSTDRMMALMMQQNQENQRRSAENQQQQTQMLMAMMTAMNSNNQSQSSGGEVEALKAELARMRQETQSQAELAKRDREISELRQQMVATQSKKPENEWLPAFMSSMQNSSSQNNQVMVEMMKMANQKPHEMEMLGNFMATISTVMANNFEGQANLLKVMKEMNEQGEPGVKDFIMKGIEGVTELGSQMLEAQAAKYQGQDDDEEYEQEEAQVVAPVPETSLDTPIAGLPEPENDEDDEDEEPVELLDEQELDQLERDSALQKAIASLANGDHPSEATVRIVRHSASGNRIALKWIRSPYELSEQILDHMNTRRRTVNWTSEGGPQEVDLAERLADDIVSFFEQLEQGVKRQELESKWSKTGYNPHQKKAAYVDPAVKNNSADEKDQTELEVTDETNEETNKEEIQDDTQK